jgi:hypothetical protein
MAENALFFIKKEAIKWFPLSILALGIFLRIHEYFNNRSLWFDEALLALNIVNRGFDGLLRPLDNAQGAPLGFLFEEKAFTQLLGNSEPILRLFPFICGMVSLLLFYKLAKTYLKFGPFLLALTLFAFSDTLVYYSAELKQYSTDVLFSVLILLVSVDLYDRPLTRLWVFIYGGVGCISIWFSHPSVFVLAGVGLTHLISSFFQKKKSRFYKLLFITTLWGINFLIVYFLSLRNLADNQALLGYWENYFAPFPPKSWADISWLINSFISIFNDPVGLIPAGLAAITFLWGCVILYRRNKGHLFLFVSSFPFVLMASALHTYPLSGRLMLFLIPPILLVISEGAFNLKLGLKPSTLSKISSIILVLALLAYPLGSLINMLFTPRVIEESLPAINYIKSHWTLNDKIYVYCGAEPAFRYYAPRFGFNPDDYFLGISSRHAPEKYFLDLAQVLNIKRVWILFSHIYPGEDKIIITFLESQGKLIDYADFPDATVYLFDFK